MSDNKIVKWIMETDLRRWILFLPLSIVCSSLGNLVWKFLELITLGIMISPESFSFRLSEKLGSGIIFGFLFVYVGGYIAPHKDVKIFLLSLAVILSLMALYRNIFMFESPDYWMCLYFVFVVVGAFLGRKYLNDDGK